MIEYGEGRIITVSNVTNTHSLRVAALGTVIALAFALAVLVPGLGNANENDDDEKNTVSDIDDLVEGKGEFKLENFPKELERKFETRQATLTINPHGKVLIVAGEVTEANWPNLKAKIWGNVLSVHVMPDAKLIGLSNTATSSVQVAVGDRVDILGYAEEATGLIHATTFKNRSQANKEADGIRARIQELLKLIDDLRAQLKLQEKATGPGF